MISLKLWEYECIFSEIMIYLNLAFSMLSGHHVNRQVFKGNGRGATTRKTGHSAAAVAVRVVGG